MNKFRITLILVSILVLLTPKTANLHASIFDFKKQKLSAEYIKKNLKLAMTEDDEILPSEIVDESARYWVDYSINEDLEDFIKNKIKRYRPEHISVVVLNNNTGGILTAIDYSRKSGNFGRAMSFSSTHPAASIFKIITAAELLEKGRVTKNTPFAFTGRSGTLYKNQLDWPRKRRAVRMQTFEEAFARSNNVVFAKAAIQNTFAANLSSTARDFGFQGEVLSEMNMGTSQIYIPETQFELAELASGFNTGTTMSPVHGAVVASVVANRGFFKTPHIVESVLDSQSKETVWLPSQNTKRVLSDRTADDLKEMMAYTVKKGTAKKSFRKGRKAMLEKVIVGGKTGTITGGFPRGKHDWFVSFAIPRERANDNGISICVMIVNNKKWYVKSSMITKDIINYYYDDIVEL